MKTGVLTGVQLNVIEPYFSLHTHLPPYIVTLAVNRGTYVYFYSLKNLKASS